MYYLPTSCLVFFFLFSLFHPRPCSSSKLDWCYETLFQCGNITAGFPFWGGNRDRLCGHPLLELNCIKNITSIFISNQEFEVLQMNQPYKNTLTLARTDHLGPFCSSNFTNITLPREIFQLPPTYKSLTVFYHCAIFHPYLPSDICPEKGFISVAENPGYHETCLESFTVNVPTSLDPEEKDWDLAHLESTLKEGFEVKVKVDENACQECLSSHERCDFNESLPSGVQCGPLPPPTGQFLRIIIISYQRSLNVVLLLKRLRYAV